MSNQHKITVEKVREFLRRNGYDSMPEFGTLKTAHLVVTREVGISISEREGLTVAEVIFTSRFTADTRVSEPFTTMEDFTSFFLNLGVTT